jgi:replicative DNA helicase
MLQMSVGIAKQQAGDVLIWSQEMNRNQLISRMVATESGVSANLIRKKKLDQASLVKIEAAYDRLNDLPLHVQDSSGVNIEEVRATARQMKRRSGKISAIIVDYLTIMDIPHQKGETRSQAVGKVTRKAKQIAREMDCPFIMLAQMSREGIKVGRPKLEHLRDSGEIEQDADVVEFLWHHEDIQKESGIPISQGKVVESIIAKGRDVGTNEFQYVFKGWRQIYDELERYNLKKIK